MTKNPKKIQLQQKRYKEKMRKSGRCLNCGSPHDGKYYMCRRCLDKEAVRKRGSAPKIPAIPKKDWDSVDWMRSDHEIAKIMLVTKQAVSYQRKKRNKSHA